MTSSGPDSPSLLLVTTVSSTLSHFLVPHAAHMRTLGWRVDAAAAGALADPALAEAFDHVHELPLSRSMRDVRGMLAGERAVSRLLQETEPDVVHVHTPIASFVTRLAAHRMPPERRPAVIYTAHGFHFHKRGHPATNAVFLTAERVAGRWTDRLVVINDEDEEAARQHRIVPVGRLVRHPGIGLDTARYSPSVVTADQITEARATFAIPGEAPLFVVVGELNRNKRQADAIAALARLTVPDGHLVMVGDGPLRADLEAQALGLGVADRVHFAGFIEDVRPVLVSAIALVAPSKREGLSRSVMEALSLEVPVVASNARGNAELVGDSGSITAIGDIDAMAQAMGRLASEPDERRSMGVLGRARMVERYDVRRVTQLHERLYSAVAAERASRTGS